jgi:hypothetical protein
MDTEFNGFGGALLSLALVPEDGQEFYVTLECADPIVPWVQRNVIPYLDHVPVGLLAPRVSRSAAAEAVSVYLCADPEPELVADWPEDFTQFCSLLMTGPGTMVPLPPTLMRLLPLQGFSPSQNSAVPHNALHDARALREHFHTLLD